MSDFKAKCTKFDFRCGSAPDPAGGSYSAPPDPLAAFKGPSSNGREGKGRERKGRERRAWEGKEGESCPPTGESGSASVCVCC